jgi:hypothetical protein
MSHFKRISKFQVATLLVAVSAATLVSSVSAMNKEGTATPSAYPVNPYGSPALAEINKLLDAKVDADVLIAYIQNSPATFYLNATEIIALKDRGASSEVLKALLDHQGRSSAPPVVSAPQNYNVSPPPTATYAPQAAYPSYAYGDAGYDYPYSYSYPYSYGYVSPSFYFGASYGYPFGYSRYCYPYSYCSPFGFSRFSGHGFRAFGPGRFGNFSGSFGVRDGGFRNSGGFRGSSGFRVSTGFSGGSGGFRTSGGGGFHGSGGGFGGHSGGFGGHSGGGGGGHSGGGRR